jgi:hypothetical protein
MRSLRRPRVALIIAIMAVVAIATLIVAQRTMQPPTSAAPQATILPTTDDRRQTTAEPTADDRPPTATPQPTTAEPTADDRPPTARPQPTVEPTATPELIMLIPLVSTPGPQIPSSVVDRPSSSAVDLPSSSACPSTGAAYDALDAFGFYKGNRLTDENADLRLSTLGYAEVGEPPALVDYDGATDPGAPQLSGLLASNRGGVIARTFRRYDWTWNESGPPPYGARGGLNGEWPATVVELAAQPGETVFTPPRPADIGAGFVALALYVGDDELTLAYFRQDGVADGYVVHLRGLCTDPALVAAYRAQLTDGRRATGRLPALRSGQPLGVARSPGLIVAVRDRGAFMDPRSRKDWWR